MQYNQNSHTALIVNTDWLGVQNLVSPEITRLAPHVPGLDVHVQTVRQIAKAAPPEGAAMGTPEPEQELNPAEAVADPDQEPGGLGALQGADASELNPYSLARNRRRPVQASAGSLGRPQDLVEESGRRGSTCFSLAVFPKS